MRKGALILPKGTEIRPQESVGDFDVVKKVLAAEGEIGFWRVRMKPGKPLAFGHIRGVPILGLPGNPVSAMVSTVRKEPAVIPAGLDDVVTWEETVRWGNG